MIDLQTLTAMGGHLTNLHETLSGLEQQVKDVKVEITKIEQNDLPAAMQEAGVDMFKLKDGTTIEIKEDFHCGITKARFAEAIGWLLDNHHGGIIKTSISVEFGRNEQDAASKAKAKIEKVLTDRNPIMKEVIHPAALKSFLREEMESGRPVPIETFGINPYNRIEIAMPKKGKGKKK